MIDLKELLAPVTESEFLQYYLGRRMLRLGGAASRFSRLFTWKDLNSALRHHQLATDGRLYLSGAKEPATQRSRVPAVRRSSYNDSKEHSTPHGLSNALRNNTTLVSESVDRYCEPVGALATKLERSLKMSVQVDAHASCGASCGFDVRIDPHHVLVLQLSGQTLWRVYGRGLSHAPTEEREHGEASCPADPICELSANAGSVLYLPREWWYAVAGGDAPSLYLSIRIQPLIATNLLHWLIDCLTSKGHFVDEIPHLGDTADQGAYLAIIRATLNHALSNPEVTGLFVKHQAAVSVPRSAFTLPWSATINALPPTPDYAIRGLVPCPPEVMPGDDGDAVVLTGNGKQLFFSAAAAGVLHYIFDKESLSYRELAAAFEGTWDTEQLRGLLADLVKEGVIVCESHEACC